MSASQLLNDASKCGVCQKVSPGHINVYVGWQRGSIANSTVCGMRDAACGMWHVPCALCSVAATAVHGNLCAAFKLSSHARWPANKLFKQTFASSQRNHTRDRDNETVSEREVNRAFPAAEFYLRSVLFYARAPMLVFDKCLAFSYCAPAPASSF